MNRYFPGPAREHLVQHRPESVDIHCRSDGAPAPRLLRRHVIWSPHGHPGGREVPSEVLILGQSEIGDLGTGRQQTAFSFQPAFADR